MSITIETRGRRHYLVGDTYPIRGAIKAAGCRWDAEAKAWWSGKRETAEALVADVGAGKVEAVASYAKLQDDSWGVRVPGAATVGATVTVVTKSGDSRQETIVAVLSTDERGSLCSIKPRERRSPRTTRSGYRRGSPEDRDYNLAYRNWAASGFSRSGYYSSGMYDEES
jgi:hypothetical protein